MAVKKFLSPKQYASLSIDDKDFYYAEFKEYKEQKRRIEHECDCNSCTKKYDGWRTIKVPVGEPYQYVKLSGYLADIQIYNARRLRAMSTAFNEPVNNSRTIFFTRYSPLEKDAKS